MNKRITSLLLCLVLLFSTMATAVPAFAEGTASAWFTVKADKTSAKPGDEINLKVYFKQTGKMTGLQAELVIPDGLTYVTGSGKLSDDVAANFPWTDAGEGVWWTEEAMLISGFGSVEYTTSEEIVLLEFKCKVNSDAAEGNYTVSLAEIEADGGIEEGVPSKNPTAESVTIAVTLPHTHAFTLENTEERYLKSAATCTAPAVYYKSCSCGVAGDATFTSGSALGHDYSKKTETNVYIKAAAAKCTENNTYWYACSRCAQSAGTDSAAADKFYTGVTTGDHSFTERLEDDAHYVAGTGTDCLGVKQYYYDCAYCDRIGTATWNSETKGPHSYSTEWSKDASGHWHECSLCHDRKDVSAHNPGAEATETAPQLCTDCGYVIHAALGHTHSMSNVDAKAASCTEAGNKAYYICSGCGNWYEDATGNVEITDHNSVNVPALGHDYTDRVLDDDHKKDTATDCRGKDTYWYSCSRCNNNAKDDASAGDKWFESDSIGPHSYDESDWGYKGEDGHAHKCRYDDTHDTVAAHVPGAAATETEAQLCTECGYVIAPALGHTHSMIKVEAKAAACTEDGNREYYRCEDCGKLFADATGNVELTADETVVPATGHDYEWKTDRKATATETGSMHEECKNCGDKKTAVEIPVTEAPEKQEVPESPKTGDSSNIILLAALLVISGTAVAGTVYCSRRRRSE